jgi:dipeptidyl aminopeptidase/acylaminoacyl peptidase
LATVSGVVLNWHAAIKYAILPTSFEQFESYFSKPQAIQFPTDDGEVTHAFYYPPNNPDWQAPSSEKPVAALALVHGAIAGAVGVDRDVFEAPLQDGMPAVPKLA